jgi:dTDP-glucose pyrophosphorylase
MRNWERSLVAPETTLRDALAAIDAAGCQLALVVDDGRKLIGTLSDGDARRALLKGLELTDTVTRAMHRNPTVVRDTEARPAILATMRKLGLHQIPIVDANHVVVGLEVVDDFLKTRTRDNWVVVMAGGMGTRLQELTRDTPKPLLMVGSRPVLETLVRGYAAQGFRRFFFAVNYKAEQIEARFGDGSQFGVEIKYIRESQRMGTAGALSLLPEAPNLPVVVTNADLLTKEDFGAMVDQHVEHQVDGTMAVREYEMQVPYGVVREQGGWIEAIDEKPVQRFVVSAGIYVLSPRAVELVPRDTLFDMPQLFEAIAKQSMKARCHQINGYWLDIGRVADYERANLDFYEVFR